MTKQFEGEFKVGDRVEVSTDGCKYEEHFGRDLVVLFMDEDPGYGVGPVGNDPELYHDPKNGWLWYRPEELVAK